jgi:hypothetical protein
VDNRPFSAADWIKTPHHQIGVPYHINLNQSLVCAIYQVPVLFQFSLPLQLQYLESDDSDDTSSLLGELSLDENKEVRPDATNM